MLRRTLFLLTPIIFASGCIPDSVTIRVPSSLSGPVSDAGPIAAPGMTKDPSLMTVVASGAMVNAVSPHFQVRLGDSTVLGEFDASSTPDSYSISTRLDLNGQDVRVYLTSDGTLNVEKIIINGMTYLSTDPKVYGEALSPGHGCQKGSPMTGTLNCPGFLDFPTRSTVPSPIPSEAPEVE